MSLELAIKDHAAALLELAAAIRSAAGGATVNIDPVNVASTKADDKPSAEVQGAGAEEPIYWANNIEKTFGQVASQADYDKLKKKQPKLIKITEVAHAKKVKEAEDAAAAAAAEAAGGGDDADAPTKADLAAAFGEYLPKDLDKETRDERHAFAKQIIARFGGPKITDMPEEHYALAINLVKRKLAGQDFDVEDAEFEEIDEDSPI